MYIYHFQTKILQATTLLSLSQENKKIKLTSVTHCKKKETNANIVEPIKRVGQELKSTLWVSQDAAWILGINQLFIFLKSHIFAPLHTQLCLLLSTSAACNLVCDIVPFNYFLMFTVYCVYFHVFLD